jgi:hypothetical protein
MPRQPSWLTGHHFFIPNPGIFNQVAAAQNARQILEGPFSAETKQKLQGSSLNFLNKIIERKLRTSRNIHDETAMESRRAVAALFHHAAKK